MAQPINDFSDVYTTADELMVVKKIRRALEIRNSELESMVARDKSVMEVLERKLDHATRRLASFDVMMSWLLPYVDNEIFPEDEASAENAARKIVAKLESPEPDLENTSLADLIRAVQSYVDNDQQITISSASEFVDKVKIDMIGGRFWVPIDDASEALTHGNALRAYWAGSF